MSPPTSPFAPQDPREIRRLAEQRLSERGAGGACAHGNPSDRLWHELQVHQIELEMQNQALMDWQSKADAALADYTDLYDSAPVGYFTLDWDGTITQSNLLGAQWLGMDRPHLIGVRFGALVAQGDVPRFNLLLQQVVAQHPTVQTCEVALMQPGSGPQMLHIRASQAGHGKGCRLVVTDLTDHQLAQALQASNDELTRVNRELDRSNADLAQFAYAASHDLIEPLRSVSGAVSLLKKRYAGVLDARADQFIDHAVDASQRMHTLIQDLLTFSRIGAVSCTVQPAELTTALATACANLQAAIAECGAQVTHDPLPGLKADMGQMAQLFQNLVGNAIKFRGDKPARVHVGARRAGNEWVLSVADQGIGIEPAHFGRIFEVFQRLHTMQEYAGNGIGLALCHKIVARHGGRIWVESEPGAGSTFFFSLPA